MVTRVTGSRTRLLCSGINRVTWVVMVASDHFLIYSAEALSYFFVYL